MNFSPSLGVASEITQISIRFKIAWVFQELK